MQKFSNEMIAQANALEAEGISTRRTVERLRAMFPGEDIPAQNSIAVWRRKMLESIQEELEENEVRIARRADELVTQKLDYAEGHIDKARLGELVITAGVYRDKGFKRQEPRHQPSINAQNVVIILNAKEPIEGEATEVPSE